MMPRFESLVGQQEHRSHAYVLEREVDRLQMLVMQTSTRADLHQQKLRELMEPDEWDCYLRNVEAQVGMVQA